MKNLLFFMLFSYSTFSFSNQQPSPAEKLLSAAEMGDRTTVLALLDSGVSADSTAQRDRVEGVTPLQLAAKNGHSRVIQDLLVRGANPNLCNSYHRTALIYASWNGQRRVVEKLIFAGADLKAKDRLNHTAIAGAAGSNHIGVLLVLINEASKKGLLSEVINAQDSFGMTPLMHAALRGHFRVCQILVNNGANLDLLNNHKRTAIALAARAKDKRVVELLHKAGANLELGMPIHIDACHVGALETLTYLAKSEYDLKKTVGNGWDGLMIAAREGRINILPFLISQGLNVNAVDNDHFSVLCHAALFNHVDVMECLVEAGADPLQRAKNGMTALHVAVQQGHVRNVSWILTLCEGQIEKTQFLLTTPRSNNGDTVLHTAIREANKAIQATRTNRDPQTLLQAMDRMEIVQNLLAAGAPREALNSLNQRPIDLAQTAGLKAFFA